MTVQNLIRLNVALSLPQAIREQAIQLSRDIAKRHGSYFTLDGIFFHPAPQETTGVNPWRNVVFSRKGNVPDTTAVQPWCGIHPHVTLYSPEYPAKNQEKVIDAVKEVSKNVPCFLASPLTLESHEGYIGIELKLSDEIRRFHETLVRKLNPLREGHIREQWKLELEGNRFSGEEKENVKKYGSPTVLTLYRPHLTILRLKDEDATLREIANLRLEMNPFPIDTIGVYTMGDHGTCRELVQEFALANQPIKDYSFGVIPILKKENANLVLLVHHQVGHWSFPKGHPIEGETELETAKREFQEETGITEWKIFDPTIFFEEHYFYPHEKTVVDKTVKYFLGIVQDPAVVVQEKEVQNSQWVSFDEALNLITFDGAKEVLKSARKYIDERFRGGRVFV